MFFSFADVSKDAMEENLLIADEETTDALAEFAFVMEVDPGSESDVTVIEVDENDQNLEEMDIHIPEDQSVHGQCTVFVCMCGS